MTQQGSTTNWVIQNTGGQVVKIQSVGRSITGIMTSAIPGQHVKMPQTFTTGAGNQRQVIKAVVPSGKILTKAVPITVTNATIPKAARTVKLTSSQVQQMQSRIINSSSQKIQISEGLTNVPVLQPAQNMQQTSSVQNQKNASPHILSRKRQDPLSLESPVESKRSRKSDKVGKGLRHFSMKVCEKVKTKGTTTYNEVADELVGEFINPFNNTLTDQQYDQKNIRRRVYDALNVLMAMNIISKEKKEIKWIGLPTNSLQECIQLEEERLNKLQTIREKKKQLHELILNQIAFKNLAQRNKLMEEVSGVPAPNSYIQLPFIVVNTSTKTRINCNVSDNKMEYVFEFNDRYEVNDDAEILKMIGMYMGLDTGNCSPENLERMKSMVPPSLEDYVVQMARGGLNDDDEYLETELASTSAMSSMGPEDFPEATLDEDNSRQSSSYDNLDYSDLEGDSDMSTDTECN